MMVTIAMMKCETKHHDNVGHIGLFAIALLCAIWVKLIQQLPAMT